MKKAISNRFGIIAIGLSIAGSAIALSVKAPPEQSWPLELTSQDSIHRLNIPASVLATSKSSDLSDIQVIDAKGNAMSMTWLSNAPTATVTTQQKRFEAYPIIGDVQQLSNSSLHITDRNGQRTVELSDSDNAKSKHIIGALIDTRTSPAGEQTTSITLDADTPVGELVSLTISSSDDLSNWQVLSDNAVITQLKQNDSSLVQNTIALPPTELHKKYLRITWSVDASIKLRSATLINQTSSTQNQAPEAIALVLPKTFTQQNRHQPLVWQLPHPMTIRGIDIQMQTSTALTPVRLYGRASAEARWQLLHSGIVFKLTRNGQTQHNTPFNFDVATTVQELRIETDKNSNDLPVDITVSMLIAPRQVVFISSGSPPYELVSWGKAQPAEVTPTLALSNMIPNYQVGDEFKLPLATMGKTNDDSIKNTISKGIQSAEPKRPYLLWAILIGAVLLLIGMVLVIVRQMKRKEERADP